MILILLIGVFVALAVLSWGKKGRSLWWPTLGLMSLGLVGMLAVILGMEQATMAQLREGNTPTSVAFGGLAVLGAIGGLAMLATWALLRRWRVAK